MKCTYPPWCGPCRTGPLPHLATLCAGTRLWRIRILRGGVGGTGNAVALENRTFQWRVHTSPGTDGRSGSFFASSRHRTYLERDPCRTDRSTTCRAAGITQIVDRRFVSETVGLGREMRVNLAQIATSSTPPARFRISGGLTSILSQYSRTSPLRNAANRHLSCGIQLLEDCWSRPRNSRRH